MDTRWMLRKRTGVLLEAIFLLAGVVGCGPAIPDSAGGPVEAMPGYSSSVSQPDEAANALKSIHKSESGQLMSAAGSVETVENAREWTAQVTQGVMPPAKPICGCSGDVCCCCVGRYCECGPGTSAIRSGATDRL
jgi:hypothetical protein